MAAPTEIYIDPSIAADSGAGTIGDPYGDTQFALDSVTRDATNGDRFNILAGTDEILSAALDLTTYGTPSLNAPVTFQGYTSAAGDGGIGGISGGGSVAIYSAAGESVYFKDLHLHNCGSAAIVTINQRCGVFDCELNNTSGSGVLCTSISDSIVAGCNFHDIGTYGVSGFLRVVGCYFANGTKSFARAINLSSGNGRAIGNTISIGGASIGIYYDSGEWECIGNSILSSAGTGKGIEVASGGEYNGFLVNNLVEGFSGTGGVGIKADGTRKLAAYGGNAAYNNTTNFSVTQFAVGLGDNEELSASPFAKSGSDTFANRGVYFGPVDTGNVLAT